ncbi:hypothetical protein [Maridesulfovibrio ferrireducens]|uniref:hypothetical protein n=1 Tax=Maridesulfovibrio ferrireducens TaxID=246191 RepID=UPI001A3561A9|nr:hypothetical protein [Maridesulfovibrio ferrireducens]MBI9110080.1 hypothetical protein [Maridesulfovibrio ferrireducens]
MLKAGLRVQVKTSIRKRPYLAYVDRLDPRGFWVGFKIVNGRMNKTRLCIFRPKHVTAIETEAGLRCIFQEAL